MGGIRGKMREMIHTSPSLFFENMFVYLDKQKIKEFDLPNT